MGEEERKILGKLIPFIELHAERIAKEFYDWQFGFAPTRSFFENYARQRGMDLATLRSHLEEAQKGYLISCFTGAESNWGRDYFDVRLHIGVVHDRINLPFKWYVGAYTEFFRLLREGLRKTIKNAAQVAKAEEALLKVFNYDMQAIGDSFLLNTMESMGLSIESIASDPGKDKTEHLEQFKKALATLLLQAKAISEGKLGDKVLEEQVAGRMGEAFSGMVRNLKQFVTKVSGSSESLASSASRLTDLNGKMKSDAEKTHAQANAVSAAATQVSSNIQTVATAAEEMDSSIKEIAKNATEAAKVATAAVKMAEKTNVTVTRLGESSAEIDKVVKVITSIAEQTNLLALNATIEAARAGEAGKGFAVVANEVKELAKGTAKATDEISGKIDAIRADIDSVVQAIGQISAIVNQINEFQSSIAGAVEQQTATTKEIGRNVSEAAKGSVDIASNVAEVATAAQSTLAAASETQKAAQDLLGLSGELSRMVESYR